MYIPRPQFVSDVEPVEPVGDQPVGATRPGREPLEPRRARRWAQLRDQLLNPGIQAEDAGQLTFEANRIYDAFQPRNGWQDWLTSAIATLMFRLSRCERIERKLRDLASFRAIDLWEEDQALLVENQAARLGAYPARVVRQLRETPLGIDWLIGEWERLARLDSTAWADLDREQTCLLLGGNNAIDPTEPGFAQVRVAELRNLRCRVEEADAITRGLVEADLCDDKVAGLARLRRYSRSLHRQMKWYIDQFHVDHSDRWDDPRRQPAAVAFDLMKQQQHRTTAYSFNEPTPVAETKPFGNPETDETKPFGNLERVETKPFASPQRDETKPLAAAEGVAATRRPPIEPRPPGGPPSATIAVAAGVVPGVTDQARRVEVADYATERGRNHDRPLKAGEPSREYARRQRAARRRTNQLLVGQT